MSVHDLSLTGLHSMIHSAAKVGYNAMIDKVENLLEAGVIDPAKVTRNGLLNAVSIAGIMLTTQVGRPLNSMGAGETGGWTIGVDGCWKGRTGCSDMIALHPDSGPHCLHRVSGHPSYSVASPCRL